MFESLRATAKFFKNVMLVRPEVDDARRERDRPPDHLLRLSRDGRLEAILIEYLSAQKDDYPEAAYVASQLLVARVTVMSTIVTAIATLVIAVATVFIALK